MGTRLALAALFLAGGCKALIGDAPGGGGGTDSGGNGGDDAPAGDAPVVIDAGPSIDAALGPWSTPAPIPTAATAKGEDDPTLSSDGLELIFALDTGANGKDLFVATRATRADAFGTPTAIPGINTANADEAPRLSADDRTLYWARNGDIMQATRTAKGQPFTSITAVAFANTPANVEKWFDTCEGTTDYLVTRANGTHGQDLFEGTIGTAPAVVPALNSDQSEISTLLSPDCLQIHFASNRAVGAANPVRLYASTRTAVGATWTAPTPVTDFGVSDDDEDLYLSPDGHIAVFATTRGGNGSKDLYMSTR